MSSSSTHIPIYTSLQQYASIWRKYTWGIKILPLDVYILITMWGCFCWNLSVTLSSYNRFSSSTKGRAVVSDYSRKRKANMLSAVGASDGMQNSHVHLLQTWHFMSLCVQWKKCPYTTHTHTQNLTSTFLIIGIRLFIIWSYMSHTCLHCWTCWPEQQSSNLFHSQARRLKKKSLQVNISCCEGAPCNILCLSRMICDKLTLR